MSPALRTRGRIALLAAVALLAMVAIVGVRLTHRDEHFTFEFTQAVGLHVGDSVTVLDVPVGKVTAIRPGERSVSVEVAVDHGLHVPQDAHGTIVAPSLVSIRHVEISPVYAGGATLADGATVPVSRTAVPVEWNAVTRQLSRLATALGPSGADKDGAVSTLLKTTAKNLRGQGPSLSHTLTSLNRAMTTLSDNRGSVFATVRNLQVFVDALSSSDTTVHDFTIQLDQLTDALASDRGRLRQALPALATALHDVQGFLKKNAGSTETAVTRLRQLSTRLAAHRQGLADVLQSAPTGLANYYDTYDPDVPAMTGVFVGANFESPATFLCSTLYSLGGTPAQCQSLLDPIVKYFATQMPPIGIDPINRNGSSNQQGGTKKPSTPSSTPTDPLGQLGNLLLGGILPGLTGGAS